MTKYLIDENLPYHFELWNSSEFVHVLDLLLGMTDNAIWDYAQANNLTIVTKDADFSNKIMLNTPPPKVIHIKTGNMKINILHSFLHKNWDAIIDLNKSCKLVNVFNDRIEGIA